jgi:hypothetical protein
VRISGMATPAYAVNPGGSPAERVPRKARKKG